MALAYTAPTWTDGSGQGITASQLQALCNCVEGLVQGSDKAVHSISINGSVLTVTFADGSIGTSSISGLKWISSIAKTGTSGLVDTYTITYSDGSTTTFTVTNGATGPQGPAGPQGPQGIQGVPGDGDMNASDYDSDEVVKDAGGIVDYVTGAIEGKANTSQLDSWSTEATLASGNTVTFSNLNDAYGYELYSVDDAKPITWTDCVKSGSGSSMQLVYTVSGSTLQVGISTFILRILK